MKKYLLGLSLLAFVNTSFADMSGEWSLKYDYNCDGTSADARYRFKTDGTWKRVDGSPHGVYLDSGNMLILLFYSPNSDYPTTYSGRKESFDRYRGIMRNWDGTSGCFTLTKSDNLDSENQIEHIEN
ncbi:hypothetical protein [Spartinivicinus ruber]|uniref:hypothetical protein n=1 Tax=Spartinivicinus ruber TaxID=2683272 RepID=UPI0013D7B3B7|nr:hypothetical protein [Spartinivicinus ruber]